MAIRLANKRLLQKNVMANAVSRKEGPILNWSGLLKYMTNAGDKSMTERAHAIHRYGDSWYKYFIMEVFRILCTGVVGQCIMLLSGEFHQNTARISKRHDIAVSVFSLECILDIVDCPILVNLFTASC